MIKKLLTIILALHLSTCGALCVCPVSKAMSVHEIEKVVNEKFEPVKSDLYVNNTITGFIISVKDELLFDENGELNESGKAFLEALSEIMKESGRKWMILCHSKIGKSQVEQISRTSLRAGAITNYLTSLEKCLINQLFPMGFGSIMPTKHETASHQSLSNRVDFVIEEYNLKLD